MSIMLNLGLIENITKTYNTKCRIETGIRLLKIDLSKNQVTTQFKGHEDWVLTAAVSSDQTRVATGAHDGEIKIWNLVDGALINSWIAQPPVQEAAKTEP